MTDSIKIPVPKKYTSSKTTMTPHVAVYLSVTKEIEDFMKDENLVGPVKLLMGMGDGHLFYLRFDEPADAVRFKLMFPAS